MPQIKYRHCLCYSTKADRLVIFKEGVFGFISAEIGGAYHLGDIASRIFHKNEGPWQIIDEWWE